VSFEQSGGCIRNPYGALADSSEARHRLASSALISVLRPSLKVRGPLPWRISLYRNARLTEFNSQNFLMLYACSGGAGSAIAVFRDTVVRLCSRLAFLRTTQKKGHVSQIFRWR